MLVLKIKYDEKGEGDKAFGSHFLTDFNREFLQRMLQGPPILEISAISVPDHFLVKVESPEKPAPRR